MRSARRGYGLRLIAVWGWVGAWTVGLMILSDALGHGFAFSRELRAFPWVTLAYALVGIGALPVLLSAAAHEEWRTYGLGRTGLGASLVASAGFVVFVLLMAVAFGQARLPQAADIPLGFPLTVVYAALATLAWGPLEVFFVLWLAVNADRLFGSRERIVGPGLVLTLALFWALHLVAARGGVGNATAVTVIFLVLGAVFGRTRNAWGPMIAWTVLNPQVWAFWRALLAS
jgi:hypothetical protein